MPDQINAEDLPEGRAPETRAGTEEEELEANWPDNKSINALD